MLNTHGVFPAGEHARLCLQAHDSGELKQRLDEGADGFKGWISKLGKQHKLKGKGLWMPVRIALTGAAWLVSGY